MRVRIRVAGNFGDGVQRPFRGRVVAQYPVALAHLLESANGVGFGTGTVPHLLTLHERRVPMVVVRVGAENPVMSLRGRNCHRGLESGSNIHGRSQKAKQNMRVSRVLGELNVPNLAGRNGRTTYGYLWYLFSLRYGIRWNNYVWVPMFT